MRRVAVATALLGSLSLASASSAQFQVNPTARGRVASKRLEVSGFVGAMSINQDLGTASNLYQSVSGEAENIDFGKLFGFRASWAFTPNLVAEFNVARGNNAYTYTVDDDDDEIGTEVLPDQFEAKQLFLGGNLIFQFPRGRFVPYVSGGGGLNRTTPTDPIAGIDRVSAFDINFGGGIKVWFSSPNWLAVRADLRYHTATDGLSFGSGSSNPTGLEFTVGASVAVF